MTDAPEDLTPDLPEQVRVRLDKRAGLLASGVEPYAAQVERSHTLAEVREAFPDLAPGTETGQQVAVAARVVFLRNTGKLCFVRLRAGDGTELQAMLSLDRVGEEALAQFKAVVDIGDHLAVRGEVVQSRRDELSVMADSWTLASKALRPLPVEHRAMSEESRVRQRYVDLVVNGEARTTARQRVQVVRTLRDRLHAGGFDEVETPILQVLHGGAAARPFVTHMNAYDVDLYLRIATELFLKRAVVGGFENVFEIGRVFRNEGADSTHSPEYALLEAYAVYRDYRDVAALTRELVQHCARALTDGSTTVTHADGSVHDLGGEWDTVDLFGSVSVALGEEISPESDIAHLRSIAAAHEIEIDDDAIHGKVVEEIFEELVAPTFTGPTFVMDFPVDTSPLVRQHRSRAGLVEKWDLYIGGFELATGYTELVDPVVQRERLVAQAALAAGGDVEAMPLDEDFLEALEYGMPPLGGLGMGVDRLLMALTGRGIRETILFPLVRRR